MQLNPELAKMHPTAPCPICASQSRAVYENRAKRLIYKCEACGHHFVANLFTELEINEFYQGEQYFKQNCNHQGISSLNDDAQWQGWVNHRLGQLQRFVFEAAKPQAGYRVFEFGCLEGRVLKALSERGFSVAGCDVNAEIVAKARELYGLDLRCGDMAELDFEPGSFDLVFSFHTLEHLAKPREALRESFRLLAPGGTLFFEIPLNETDYENLHHLHFFSLDSLKLILKPFFRDVKFELNSFRTANGQLIESVLAVAVKP